MDVTERSGFFNLSRSGPERIFAHRKSHGYLRSGYPTSRFVRITAERISVRQIFSRSGLSTPSSRPYKSAAFLHAKPYQWIRNIGRLFADVDRISPDIRNYGKTRCSRSYTWRRGVASRERIARTHASSPLHNKGCLKETLGLREGRKRNRTEWPELVQQARKSRNSAHISGKQIST